MPRSPHRLAKLTRPRLRKPVLRERLFAILDAACGQVSAVALSGPPGAGKTSLVASWLDARGRHGIWYRVDGGDDDPATFFHYLGIAVRDLAPRARVAMPALTAEYAADLPGFTRRFFRELFARMPAGATLVLDNFQEAAETGPLPGILADAVAEVPTGATVILLSRLEPPDRFARCLATESMARIRPEALALTVDEAVAMASARGVTDEGLAHRLSERCGGWAAGLTLLLEGEGVPGTAAAGDDPRSIDRVFAFLADQVFGRMAADEQRFLVRTAFLPAMTAEMAEALTGHPRAGDVLRSLYRRHLFTHRTPGSEGQFQYHALFRDFLRGRAAATLDASERQAVLCDAGGVCAVFGLPDAAVELFLEAGAWDRVSRVLVAEVTPLLDQGRIAQLRGWIGRIPGTVVAADATLGYALGSVLAATDPPAAIAALTTAHACHREAREGAGMLRCAAALVEVIFYATSDHRQMLPWIDVLSASMARPPVGLDDDLALRARAALLIALLFSRPVDPELSEAAQRTLDLLDGRASVGRRLMAAVNLLIYATFTGRFDLAPTLCVLGDRLAGDPSAAPYGCAHWRLWQAYLFRLLGRHADGHRVALEADAIAIAHGFRQVRFLAAYFRSGIASAEGRSEEAARLEAEARTFVDPSRKLQAALLASCTARRALHDCDWPTAAAYGEQAMAVARTLAAPSYRIHYGIPYVAALVECGALDTARAVLAEQRAVIAGTALRCFEPLLLAVDARIAECTGDAAGARRHVAALWREAAALGHGCYLSWVEPWMARHADWGLQDGIEPGFIRSVIASQGWRPAPGCSEAWPWPLTVRTLGGFEVRVEGEPLRFGRKVPRRPLDLLRALVAHGGSVQEDVLAEHLWPGEEADAAHRALGAALHRLRALLGRPDAVLLKGGRITLNSGVAWIDLTAFEAALDAARGAGSALEILEAAATRARDLYRGAFLAGDRDDAWILSTRERLRGRFIQLIESVSAALEGAGRHADAIRWYERGIEVDELAETFHLGLMRCLRGQGRNTDAIRAYRRLQRTLSRAFGRAPSAPVEALFLAIAGGS